MTQALPALLDDSAPALSDAGAARPARAGTAPAHSSAGRRAEATAWIALDVETCPLPGLGPEAQARLALETARHGDAAKAASLHPLLAYVCAVGVAAQRGPAGDVRRRVFVADAPEHEAALLKALWVYVARAEHHARATGARLRWATFNGKRFDVPLLRLRSLAHGVPLPDTGLLDTYPYADTPHLDLMGTGVAGGFAFSLDQLCALVGMASPKGEMDGSGVAAALAEGRAGAVAAYAVRDARATLALAQHCTALLPERSRRA